MKKVLKKVRSGSGRKNKSASGSAEANDGSLASGAPPSPASFEGNSFRGAKDIESKSISGASSDRTSERELPPCETDSLLWREPLSTLLNDDLDSFQDSGTSLDELDLESVPPLSQFGSLGLGLDEGVVHMDSEPAFNVGFGGHSPPNAADQSSDHWIQPPADVFQIGYKSLRRYESRQKALRAEESRSVWLAALTESRRLREECVILCCPSQATVQVKQRSSWREMARLRAAATRAKVVGRNPSRFGDYGSGKPHRHATSPSPVYGFASGSPLLTETDILVQASRLSVVMRRSQEHFDAEKHPAHLAMLLKVWKSGIKSDLKIDLNKRGASSKQKLSAWKSEEWKKLGFQHVDPITDLRGGGMLALENISYLFELYPHVPRVMNEKDLLCAATCVNVTVILLHHLKINDLPDNAIQTSSEDKHRREGASKCAEEEKIPPRRVHFLDPSAKPTAPDNSSTSIAPVTERIHMYRATQLDAMFGIVNMVSRCHDDQAILDLFGALVATGMMLVVNCWRELAHEKDEPPTLLDFSIILYSARIHLVHLLAADPRTVANLQSWASGVPSILIDPALGIP